MATIKDVAARAGVSATTVSFIMNGEGEAKHISRETIRRVQESMEELGYRKRGAGAGPFYPQKRQAIAFFWPMDYRTNILGYRLGHFQNVLQEKYPDIEIVVQTYRYNRLGDFLGPLRKGRYAGAIVGGPSEADVRALEQLSLSLPVVLLNRESLLYSTVGVNSTKLGLRAAALLQRAGHRQCAVVRAADRYTGSGGRTDAFCYACRQLGIELREEWTYRGSPTIRGGAEATRLFCRDPSRPRMLYYEADCMAQGGLYSLKEAGLAVPGDVEILAVSTQTPETMQYLSPSISTVALPPEVDRQAIELLAELVEGGRSGPVRIEIEPVVQLRESFFIKNENPS